MHRKLLILIRNNKVKLINKAICIKILINK